MPVPSAGPTDAKIMLVGEAPGDAEILRREPFVGASGQELNRMLHEAGIARSECFLTHVCRERPPNNARGQADISLWVDKRKKAPAGWYWLNKAWVHPHVWEGHQLLQKEIELVKPNIIVAFGNTSLLSLTGNLGIKSWRGSLLQTSGGTKILAAYTPAYIMRDWSQRAITVLDLKRAAAETQSAEIDRGNYNFVIRPSFATVSTFLQDLHATLEKGPVVISCDIETRAGHIACIGFAVDTTNALCIPLMQAVADNPHYWLEEEECAIVAGVRRVLCHRNARVVGQNFIYDTQYIYRHWGFVPRFARDTMLGHHVCFPGLQKGLDFLSSMYCEHHVYWKDEGKTWDKNTGEEQLWSYNCKDCVITYEVNAGIQKFVTKLGLEEQDAFQQRMFWPVLEAMVRGVRVDLDRRRDFSQQLAGETLSREAWFKDILGHPLNPKSPKQMKELFYEDLQQKPIYKRTAEGNSLTLDEDALQTIVKREPMLWPLVKRILEYRSLGVFQSSFVSAALDQDQRMRCSYNIAGTETIRLSSSKNAFDSGLNLQTIPKGGEVEPGGLQLPNVRTLFVPDPGYTFFDLDLDRADLQVVVWEADDEELRQMLREGVDIHKENAKTLGLPATDTGRQLAKVWVHGTDYGGSARTMAINCGISVSQAESMRTRWFAAHPGIARWQHRVEQSLKSTRQVTNKWGYRRYYFDRIEGLLPEALAWIPQSTVAVSINKLWLKIYEQMPDVQVLLQVHDSLAGQVPTERAEELIEGIRLLVKSIVIPYDIPLTIPVSIKTSQTSWGDCK